MVDPFFAVRSNASREKPLHSCFNSLVSVRQVLRVYHKCESYGEIDGCFGRLGGWPEPRWPIRFQLGFTRVERLGTSVTYEVDKIDDMLVRSNRRLISAKNSYLQDVEFEQVGKGYSRSGGRKSP